MIDQLCQGYHWSFQDAMKLTVPQVILMGHAAWANDKRSKARSGSDSTAVEPTNEDPWVTIGSKRKRFSEMTQKDQEEYYGRW